MPRSRRLRTAAGVLALAGLAWCVACGLVSGLDSLQEVPCVGTCGDDAEIADANEDLSFEGGADVERRSDANLDASVLDHASQPLEGSSDSSSDATLDGNLADGPPNDSGMADSGFCAPPRDASPCTGDLSNIGTADFRISLALTATQQGLTAVVNQRSACGGGMYWDVRMSSGHLMVETDDGTLGPDGAFVENPRTTLISKGTINDGTLHCVVIERLAKSLSITLDGISSGSASSVSSFAVLSPLTTGADPCEGTQDMTMAFTGTIAGLCVGGP